MNKAVHVNSRVLLVLLLLAVISLPVLAEIIVKRSAVSEVERSRYEKDLEDRLNRDIKAYLNHEFFVLEADVVLEKIDEYERTEEKVPVVEPTAAQAEQPEEAEPINQTDEQQERTVEQSESEERSAFEQQLLKEKQQQAADEDIALPGLPVSEDLFRQQLLASNQMQDQKQSEKTLRQQKKQPRAKPAPPPPVIRYETKINEKLLSSRIDVRKQTFAVILDEHVTPEQQQFVRSLVIAKANVNFIRGDELTVTRSAFPGADILDEKPEEEPVEEVDAAAPLEPEVTQEETWQDWLMANWPYILGAILLILLFAWMYKREQQLKRKLAEPPPPPPSTSDTLEELLKKMSKREDAKNENKLKAVKEELVNIAVTSPEMVNSQLNEWFGSGNNQDMERIANLYNLMGEGLFKSLFNNSLNPEKMVALAAKANDLQETGTPDERLELAESAYQVLSQRRYQEQHIKHEDIRPFSFLEKLNDDQVLYLLNDEEFVIKSLVFSQLSSARSASMLSRLPDQLRTRIASQISEFNQMPVASFRDIANRLAKKAVHVPSFANIDVDGIDVLVDVLDHMDSSGEQALLSGLQRDNPDLYYKIKQVYISFHDITNLPPLALKNLVREVEREQLALALYDMNDDFRSGVLRVLMERPRAMLRSAIQGLQNPDEAAMNEAKRVIARKAREMLKAGMIETPAEDGDETAEQQAG